MSAVKFALFLAIFGLSMPAKAENTYNFTVNSVTGTSLTASGFFTLSGFGSISSVSGTLNLPKYSTNLNSSSSASYIGSTNMYALFTTMPGNLNNSLTLSGNVTANNGNYSGLVMTGGSNIAGTGFFQAILTTGPETGGGNSGGAPSPELNTFLGLVLAAGTMAFLRRRRRGHDERAEV